MPKRIKIRPKSRRVVTKFDLEDISTDVLHKKAYDEQVSLSQFSKEITKHEKIIRRPRPPDTS